MPNAISLASYLIRIHDVTEREDEILSELPDGTDLLDYLDKQLAAMKQTRHNQVSQEVLSVSELSRSARTLIGIIETGDYGRESNIYNVDSRRIVYKRKVEEADMWPFYFRFEVPEGTDEGLLILQRTGNYGIRHVLARFLRESFANDFEDLRFRYEPIVDAKDIERYAHGAVQEVRFVKVDLPRDLEDRYDSGHKEVRGQMELVIRARRGGSLPFQRYLGGLIRKGQRTGVFAIDEGKFEYQGVKVKTKVSGTSRTFQIGDPKLRSYHDISNAVKIGKGGHPTFESLNDAAGELADRLKKQMYGPGIE